MNVLDLTRRIRTRIIPRPLSACILKEGKKSAEAARIAEWVRNIAASGGNERGKPRQISRKDTNAGIEEAERTGGGLKTVESATGEKNG